MKNIYAIVLTVMVALALVGVVSADSTIVVGTIYNSADHNIVYPDANVTVTCGTAAPMHVLSGNGVNWVEGTYVAKFISDGCTIDSNVSAHAQWGTLAGDSRPGITVRNVLAGSGLDLGLADADVFLVPEFGLLMGGLTIAGALVAFLIIRRK